MSYKGGEGGLICKGLIRPFWNELEAEEAETNVIKICFPLTDL